MERRACITAFVRVAEYSGFPAAARCLNVSTTTVSDQIQALENALGVRLLNRTTRRVSLTVVGREYYERCAQILQELTEADEAANASQMTAARPASRLLPPRVGAVHRAGGNPLPERGPGGLAGFAHRRRDD